MRLAQMDPVITGRHGALNLKIHLKHKSFAISFIMTNVALKLLKHDDMLFDLKCHILGTDINTEAK